MKYVNQFTLILAFSFAGEFLNRLLPFPVPASIYGLVMLFLALEFKLIKLEWIKDTSKFLLSIMSIFFVPSSVGFINALPLMKQYGIQFALIAVISTILVFAVTGQVTQLMMKLTDKIHKSKKETK